MIRLPSILTKYCCLLSFIFICTLLSAQQGYEINVEIDGYHNDELMLGYRLGDKTYIQETLYVRNPNGQFQFKGDTVLEGGIYLIITKPNNENFEFLVPNDDEQHFTLKTKWADGDMSQNLTVEGSKDNHMFLEYLQTLSRLGKKAENLQQQIRATEKALKDNGGSDSEKLKSLNKEMDALNAEVESYQNNLVSNFPDYLTSSLILASRTPVIPKTITEREGQYYYFKGHYWDQFDWSDQRLIRTPILQQKIEYYLDKLTTASPDSQIVACDLMLNSALKGGNRDIYQYVASHTLNKYAKSKTICMDKVYVHIGANYYCGTTKPEWIEKDQLNKICKNVEQLKNVVCGVKAPPISLTNISTGNTASLYNIDKKYTLIYFWNTECSNCEKISESLIDVYQKWKDKGFEIYSVCGDGNDNIQNIKSVSSDLGMTWINVTGGTNILDQVKTNYNNTVNPYLLLLNEDKEILYKRIDVDQLDHILENEFGGSK